MKILFVLLMFAASWAYAEDPTSDDYHDIAATLAKCSGYWSAMLPIMERGNQPAAVEELQGRVRGWEVASWMMFSAAHDPKGAKPYGAWKEMATAYSENGRIHMALLLEQVKPGDENKDPEEAMLECVAVRDLQMGLIEDYRKRSYAGEVMKEQQNHETNTSPGDALPVDYIWR
jgi:hypothetical protein